MRLQVSLTLEMDANATLASIEEQIQAAGHCWMGEALKQACANGNKPIPCARTVGASTFA